MSENSKDADGVNDYLEQAGDGEYLAEYGTFKKPIVVLPFVPHFLLKMYLNVILTSCFTNKNINIAYKFD